MITVSTACYSCGSKDVTPVSISADVFRCRACGDLFDGDDLNLPKDEPIRRSRRQRDDEEEFGY